ncbi:outer membrane beta-barrel family protein [Neptunitalea lumnitzerae]|uniref:TonB-dependent receptor n=1 Tax=Neptunitalea lumnitzerae TaxID=2965509 RepID=A0ABQ5MFI1_9FLAO|nr:outer membrane beta-barrel family protein [Neptunitalea sp. Y10]GLB48184.1 TonB-dependent receptor [Neptunitalea sp. Y10]
MKKIYILLFLFVSTTVIYGQKSVLKGTILAKQTNETIPYAEIALLKISTADTLNLGTITDDNGFFVLESVPYGTYQLTANFMGFSSLQKEVVVNSKQTDLGILYLEERLENLEEVVVTSSKAAIEYKVDRQVINASSFPQASIAVDLLKNVPSIQIDINGEVTYRGDGTFKVYINGHPVPNGTQKLQQIPADQIDKIEIITNPSAEFSAEGTAGIIQIILKKTRLEGYAINVTGSTSTLGSYFGFASIDKKTEKSGWYININGGKRYWNKIDYTIDQQTQDNGLMYQTNLEESQDNGFKRLVVEAGFNYDITPNDYIDVALNYEPIKNQNFNLSDGWVQSNTYDAAHNLVDEEYYDLVSRYKNKYGYYGAEVAYNHFFNEDKSHKLTFNTDFSNYVRPYEEQSVDSKIYANETVNLGSTNYEDNEVLLGGKLIYEVPFSENSIFNIGAEVNLDDIPAIGTENGTYDENGALVPFSDQRSEQVIDFSRVVYAGFSNFSSKFHKFEYKLGLRLENEHTTSNYAYIDNTNTAQYIPASYTRTKLFPNMHVLYNMNDKTQLTASYSRRIRRPNYFSLVPVIQYNSVTSYYQGNANIKPTYVNAYELAYKRNWTDTDYLSVQLYHRMSEGLQSSYNYNFGDGILISTPENVGNAYSTGVEFMGNIAPTKWWKTNLSITLYNYKLKVAFNDLDYIQEFFNYTLSWNNTFTINDTFSVQSNSYFYGDYKDAQSTSKASWYTSIGINKSFLDDTWSINLSGDNIFNTRVFRTVTTGTDFTNYSKMDFSPYVTLKVSYTFDNQH